jgi:membrane associated rhomboid family serine protease
MFNLTPVVKNLLMINAVVFLLQVLLPGMHVTEYMALWNVRSENFQPYQLFTYMFVHSPNSFTHIFFNMLMLSFTGPILETFWGSKRFLMFYIITGVGAGAFNVVVDYFFMEQATYGIMLGASGAIYGILMGFGMLFPNMEVQLLIPPIPIKAKYLVFFLGGLTFVMDRSGSVAHFAHLGGIVVAYIVIKIWRSQGNSFY